MKSEFLSENVTNLDYRCINTIRILISNAMQEKHSGGLGFSFEIAPSIYVLWTKFFRHNPKNPKWFGRDRIVLSDRNQSTLIYAFLYLTGYNLPPGQLKRFRQLYSKKPNNSADTLTPEVEFITGPKGQGFASGVGMGIAQSHLAARFNKPDFAIIDSYIYSICSDCDLIEGVSYEAASLAGHLKLGNLIYLYDETNTIHTATHRTVTEDLTNRFVAAGWHLSEIRNGNDLKCIEQAIRDAQKVKDKPSLIRVRTIADFKVPQKRKKKGSNSSIRNVVKGTKDKIFYIPSSVLARFRQAMKAGAKREQDWDALVKRYEKANPALGSEFKEIRSTLLPTGWEKSLPKFHDIAASPTRVYSGEVINAIAPVIRQLLGGSADLAQSNNTYIKSSAEIQFDKFQNRNIHYGVREHAMGSIMNGIALFGGIIPFGGTYLAFSDYMRPPIRLAALSHIQVIFVFTHDSIGVGENGPTHQPVEHLAALRAIPNLVVIRPCDAHEVREAWRAALKRTDGPTSLVLSQQKVTPVDRKKFADAHGLHKGGYILAEAECTSGKTTTPKLILLASGSEVDLAIKAREILVADGNPTRVVSLPCWEFFDVQPSSYKDEVLPPSVPARIAIEASVALGWAKYVGDYGDMITVDSFGISAPAGQVFRHYGFTVENIVKKAQKLLSLRHI
jgi:transketolase